MNPTHGKNEETAKDKVGTEKVERIGNCQDSDLPKVIEAFHDVFKTDKVIFDDLRDL